MSVVGGNQAMASTEVIRPGLQHLPRDRQPRPPRLISPDQGARAKTRWQSVRWSGGSEPMMRSRLVPDRRSRVRMVAVKMMRMHRALGRVRSGANVPSRGEATSGRILGPSPVGGHENPVRLHWFRPGGTPNGIGRAIGRQVGGLSRLVHGLGAGIAHDHGVTRGISWVLLRLLAEPDGFGRGRPAPPRSVAASSRSCPTASSTTASASTPGPSTWPTTAGGLWKATAARSASARCTSAATPCWWRPTRCVTSRSSLH